MLWLHYPEVVVCYDTCITMCYNFTIVQPNMTTYWMTHPSYIDLLNVMDIITYCVAFSFKFYPLIHSSWAPYCPRYEHGQSRSVNSIPNRPRKPEEGDQGISVSTDGLGSKAPEVKMSLVAKLKLLYVLNSFLALKINARSSQFKKKNKSRRKIFWVTIDRKSY